MAELVDKLLPAFPFGGGSPLVAFSPSCPRCTYDQVAVAPAEAATDREWSWVKSIRAELKSLGVTQTKLVECRWFCSHKSLNVRRLALRAEVTQHELVLSRLYEVGFEDAAQMTAGKRFL